MKTRKSIAPSLGLSLVFLLLASFLFAPSFSGLMFFGPVAARANDSAQSIPFAQSWTNAALITANDDWSLVPGIVGYRGDALTGAIGADPQTILADGAATPVNVLANQTSPDTLLSGGVAEFELANPTIALNGSGTADAPHIVINLNTSGVTALTAAYKLRDLDASGDDSVQPIALHYRVGNTGNFTNLPGAFVPDASTGPNQATLVTNVSVQLPAECENKPLVQLRIMTANAAGNDEWIGIDDITVTGTGGGEILLGGTGSANPATVTYGGSTLLTVAVTPASNPPSTGITVTGDLSSIGGASNQPFYDDGTHGDESAGDNVFSYSAAVGGDQSEGVRNLPVSIADAQARTASASIALGVNAPASASVHLTMGNPSNAVEDINQPNNYLMAKPQYVLSYNRSRGLANWVSWHLDPSWLGTAQRQDDYRPDPALPAGWYRVSPNDYSNSGFDRGHLVPSADRQASIADNSATFYMTNMMPQAPANNQGPWEDLETYLRTIVNQGNEIYIIAGSAGVGGVGANGPLTTLAGGNLTVPAYTWKVAIVLPQGVNDIDRVVKTTRVIAVIMPNRQDIGFSTPWRNFRTSVKRVEALTGLDFFTNVRPQIRRILKQKIDRQ